MSAAAQFFGITQKELRTRIARAQVPYKRWGAPLVFQGWKLPVYVEKLVGVSLEEVLEWMQ